MVWDAFVYFTELQNTNLEQARV